MVPATDSDARAYKHIEFALEFRLVLDSRKMYVLRHAVYSKREFHLSTPPSLMTRIE